MPIPGYHDLLRHYIKYTTVYNTTAGQLYAHYSALVATGYGQGPGFTYPMPKFGCYESAFSTGIPPAVSLNNHNVRAGLTIDAICNSAAWETVTTFLQMLQQWGATGMPGFTIAHMVGLQNGRSQGTSGYICSDGQSDGNATEWWQEYEWQNQPRGYGTSNVLYGPSLGGTGIYNPNNESVPSQAYADWIEASSGSSGPLTASMAVTEQHDVGTLRGTYITGAMSCTEQHDVGTIRGLTVIPAIRVSPSRIRPRIGPTPPGQLTLVGTGTAWTSGSVVTVQNSVTGTTTVTAGTFTALSATSATLAYTTGAGVGTWMLTIDGVTSPPLGVGARQKGWGFARRAPLRA